MNDNFKENLNKRIMSDVVNSIVDNLHNDLSLKSQFDDSNIYDMIQSLNSDNKINRRKPNVIKSDDADLKLALQLFLQKFLDENKKGLEDARNSYIASQIEKLNLIQSANEEYWQDNNKNYYKLINHEYVKQEQILEVRNDGSYVSSEKIKNTEYHLYKVTDKNNRELEFKVIHSQEGVVKNLNKIVKLLDMKKELVNRVKRIGYSGNSFDCFANLANAFITPHASGYYMCKKCHFWKWSFKDSAFIRDLREGIVVGSAELADYEYRDNRTIIRTDYSGKGLILA